VERLLHSNLLRGLTLVIIGIGGLLSAVVWQNALPLLISLFALIFFTASLTASLQPAQRSFVRRLGIATVTVVSAVAALNYIVNPLALYPTHFFEPLVVTTRDFKMNLYAASSPPPRVVVIGSSRSFTVDPAQVEQLWHESTLNASLTGGVMDDFLAFWRYMLDVGKPPKLLIINVAPEVFGGGDGYRFAQEPDSRLWNYVDRHDPLYPLRDAFYRAARLVSKEQLELSLRLLRSNPDRKQLAGYAFDANGMGHFYGLELTADDLKPDVLAFGNWGKIFGSYNPDAYHLDALQTLLEQAAQAHTLVIGYMPPYHPALRDVLETRTQFPLTLKYVIGQLDAFESQYPFHYTNFIDSDLFSNSDGMFYDSNHPTAAASALMMQQLYDQFHNELGAS
jgi:hypothetical protein